MGIFIPVTETSNRQGVLNSSTPKIYGLPFISKVRSVNGRTSVILDGKKTNEERVVAEYADDLSVLMATGYLDFGLAITVTGTDGNLNDNYPVSMVVKASSLVEAYDNPNAAGAVVRVRDEDLKEDIIYFTSEDIAALQALVPSVPTGRPYKVYSALLDQALTFAPTANVLENTLTGTPVWSYDGVGSYIATLANEFVVNKTAIFTGQNYNNLGDEATFAYPNDINTVAIETIDGGASTNGILINTFVEIRVYE